MFINVPFLTIKHLEFIGLNNIVAYDTVSLGALRIHMSYMLITMVTVMSSITPLLNVSVFSLVPLFAALIIMFKP